MTHDTLVFHGQDSLGVFHIAHCETCQWDSEAYGEAWQAQEAMSVHNTH